MTQRKLPTSKDLAGVNMRLTAGSFRELHWHTADQWAIVLTGEAGFLVMQPDGKMAIDDVGPGGLWCFPAGYPHSIQGLGEDGCEFLLVFDEGSFSEDDTFLLSEFLAHTSRKLSLEIWAGRGRCLINFRRRSLYLRSAAAWPVGGGSDAFWRQPRNEE